jgi:CheY-like chemotaxis protein
MGMKLLNRQLTILQVEDTASDVELTAYALKRSGIPHSVYVVTDGEQAMRFLTRGAGKLVRCEAHGFCVIHDGRPID